jgi:hypothetical protein
MECWSNGSRTKIPARPQNLRDTFSWRVLVLRPNTPSLHHSNTPIFDLLGRVKLWQVSNVLAEDIYRGIRRPA